MSSEEIDWQKAYLKLPDRFKRILQMLSLHGRNMTQSKLLRSFSFFSKIRRVDESWNAQKLRDDLTVLEKDERIVRSPQGFSCAVPFMRPALLDIAGAQEAHAMVSALLRAVPFEKKRNGVVIEDTDAYHRAVLISIFSHETWAAIPEIHRLGLSWGPLESVNDSPFLSLFNAPFNAELLEKLPVKTRIHVIEAVIKDALRTLDSLVAAMNCLVALIPRHHRYINADVVFKAMILTGRIREFISAADIRALSANARWTARIACAEFLLGNKEAARVRFVQVFLNRKNDFLLKDDIVLFLFFSMLGGSNRASLKLLRDIYPVLSESVNRYSSLIFTLTFFIDETLIRKKAVSTAVANLYPGGTPFEIWATLLVISWYDSGRAEEFVSHLEKVRQAAARGGHDWLEAEACSLLTRLGCEVEKNGQRAERLHQSMGTIPLLDRYVPVSSWEKDLSTLMEIGNFSNVNELGASDIQTRTGLRMVWILSMPDISGRCSIVPRVQTLSKNGQWSRGRAISLKKLYENHSSLEYLTEQDRRICNAIEQRLDGDGYYGYKAVDYVINEEKALPELMGHSMLFYGEAGMKPVELVKGEPELQVSDSGKNVVIRLNPMPVDSESRTSIFRETPDRFKLIRFSNIHMKMAEVLGDMGLKVPRNGRSQAADVVSVLASHVTVQTDLDIDSHHPVREIVADDTPHVHVMPYLEGVSLEVFVRPFEKKGSYFSPGQGGRNVLAEIDGEKVKAVRNLEQEQNRISRLIDRCPVLATCESETDQWYAPSPETALEVLFELKACEEEIVLKWPQGETLKVRSELSFDSFQLDIRKERDWFRASGELTVDETLSLGLEQLMEQLRQSIGRFIPLKDGTFVAITRAFQKRLEELYAYGHLNKNGLRLPPLSALALEDLTDQVQNLKTDRAWKAHVKTLKTVDTPDVPGTLQARLREYQVDGFRWLARCYQWQVGACLADDMGLGKTLQALAAILLGASEGPSLVIAPLSVMNNWIEECHRFAPTLSPQLFGPGDREAFLKSRGPFDLVIASYGLLQTEGENLASVDWQTVVLDEAQAIKNMNSKRSKAAMKLKARFRLVTTGTPVENHLSELWTLFRFLNPGLLGTWPQFKNTFVIPVERDQDKSAARCLKKLMRPFILRRIKSDVLTDLPEKTEVDLEVVMSRDESLLYEAQRQTSIEAIEQATGSQGERRIRILAELTRLRQLCCHPSLILPDTTIESSKLKVFGDLVEELLQSRHKALVFSQFVRHLSVLRSYLDRQGISYQYLDGSTSVAKRKARIKAFQGGEGDLFLISLKAGGFGLNLTAADYVIHMDPWWNPAVEDQASDRAHRIGQTRPVTVYRLIMKDSIEEQILRLHKEKRDLAASILSGSDVSASISADELLALLKHGK